MSRRARLVMFAIAGPGLAAVMLIGMHGMPAFGHYHGVYGLLIDKIEVPERHATDLVTALHYQPSGDWLASGSRDAQVKIWDTHNFELKQNIAAHLFAVNYIAFHPTQPYFATASMDKSIKLWGADDFKLYKVVSREKGYASHFLSINKILWHDGNLLSISDDKSVIIWDVKFD